MSRHQRPVVTIDDEDDDDDSISNVNKNVGSGGIGTVSISNSNNNSNRQHGVEAIDHNTICLLSFNNSLYKCRFLLSNHSKSLPPLKSMFIQNEILSLTETLLKGDTPLVARTKHVLLTKFVHKSNSAYFNFNVTPNVDDTNDEFLVVPSINYQKYTFIIQVL